MMELAQYLEEGIQSAKDIENEGNDIYLGLEAGGNPVRTSGLSFKCRNTKPARGKGGSFVG